MVWRRDAGFRWRTCWILRCYETSTVSIRIALRLATGAVTELSRLVPLLVRAVFGGRHHWPLSHHSSIFHFPLALSCLPSHLVTIPSITCCVFNPLFPLMSLSEIVLLYVYCIVCYVQVMCRCATGFVPTYCMFPIPIKPLELNLIERERKSLWKY